MTSPARYSRLRAAARLVLLAAAIGLTTWGVCLIAFAGSLRGTRLGVPIAFWGVLLGYTAIRTTGGKAAAPQPDPAEAEAQDVESPVSAELVRERDEAMRHEYEMRLEVMLRRELEKVLRTELAGLRHDVAELRGDVLDAVDGRLRMERVEITRIIGSNLAAMHDDGRTAVRPSASDIAVTASGAGPGTRYRIDDGAAVFTSSKSDDGASVLTPVGLDDATGAAREYAAVPSASIDQADEMERALERDSGADHNGVVEPTTAEARPATASSAPSATGLAAAPSAPPAAGLATAPSAPSAAGLATTPLAQPAAGAPSARTTSVATPMALAASVPTAGNPNPAGSVPAPPEPGRSPSRLKGHAGPGRQLVEFSEVTSRRGGSSPLLGPGTGPEPAFEARSEPASGPEPAARPETTRNLDPDVEPAPLTESATPPLPRAARSAPASSEAAPKRSDDPFASLPRLSAFRLPDLPAGVSLAKSVTPAALPEPIETAPTTSQPVTPESPTSQSPAPEPSALEPSAAEPSASELSTSELSTSELSTPQAPAPGAPTSAPSAAEAPAPPEVSGYVGRRRNADVDTDAEPTEAPSGRHGAASDADSTPVRASGSGRSPRPVAHRR
jgi:hypothetical protein